MADNNKKKRKKASTAAMKRMMVGGAAQAPDQEELITPMRMVVNNFLENKVAMTGLFLFFIILLCCIILPFFFPIERSFQDVTQANTAPGFKQLSVPSSLKNNAMDISVGSTYSVQVPASLELRYDSVSGKYEGSYTVAAKGSILPGQSVTVRPTAGTFVMTGSTTGEACQAAISQDVTEWVHPGRQAGAGKLHISAGEYTEAGGRVSAELTVPDTYTGEFTFAFSLGEYTE